MLAVLLAPAAMVFAGRILDRIEERLLLQKVQAAQRALAEGAEAAAVSAAHDVDVEVRPHGQGAGAPTRKRARFSAAPGIKDRFNAIFQPAAVSAALETLFDRAWFRELRREARRSKPGLRCGKTEGGLLLYCATAIFRPDPGAPTGHFLSAFASARRNIRILFDLRYQALLLTLYFLPLVLLIGWVLTRRIIAPVEGLRRDVLAQTQAKVPRIAQTDRPDDEIADLADAFRTLACALEERRRHNEAVVQDLAQALGSSLSSILDASESLAGGGEDSPQKVAAHIADCGHRMQRVVDDLAALARAETGLHDAPRAPVDIEAMLRALVARLNQNPVTASILIKIEANVRADHTVPVVAEALERAFQNLLDNGARLALQGPQPELRIAVRVDTKQLRVHIHDNGPGIAAGLHEQIFDRFFRREPDGGHAGDGTGLGLPLCRAIIEAHGGRVEAGHPPSGAEFIVVLPRHPPA